MGFFIRYMKLTHLCICTFDLGIAKTQGLNSSPANLLLGSFHMDDQSSALTIFSVKAWNVFISCESDARMISVSQELVEPRRGKCLLQPKYSLEKLRFCPRELSPRMTEFIICSHKNPSASSSRVNLLVLLLSFTLNKHSIMKKCWFPVSGGCQKTQRRGSRACCWRHRKSRLYQRSEFQRSGVEHCACS